MTRYNVHLFREMRLTFDGIEADTSEAAAAIVGDKLSSDAAEIADCPGGENQFALVDVAGDEPFEQTRRIDFHARRMRRAASALLASLEAMLPYVEVAHEAASQEKPRHNPHCQAEAEEAWAVIKVAQAAMAQAKALSIAPAGLDVDVMLAQRRQIGFISGIEAVQDVRPDLNDDQAWEVLQAAKRQHDATIVIQWDVLLRCHAQMLYGPAASPTGSLIEITEDEFDSRFPLVPNHLNPTAGWGSNEEAGCLFETFGEALEFVWQKDPRTVWTLVDGDDGDQYLLSGIHFANRLGYLISTVPVPEGASIQVHIPMENDDDAETDESEEA